MSGERISASPISTASTPAPRARRARPVELKPDSATIAAPSGTCASSSNVRRVSTSSVVRSRLLIPISRAPSSSATSSSRSSWTSTSARQAEPACLARAARSARRGERGDDQQDRVGAGRERLVHLVGVDDEVLAQERQRSTPRARRAGRRASRRSSAPRSGSTAPRRRRARTPRPRPRASGPPGSAPADGELRLCSAISDSPGRASASRERARLGARGAARPRAPTRTAGTAARRRSTSARAVATISLERCSRRQLPRPRARTARARPPPRRSSIACSRGAARRRASVSAPPARVDRGAGVEHRQLAGGARLARRRSRRAVCGVLCRVAARDLLGRRALEPDAPRARPRSGGARPRAPRPPGSAHEMDELVEPVVARDDQRVLGAEQRQRARHRLEVGRVGDADQLAAWRRPGWSAGPRKLKIVRTASSRRTGIT